MKSGTPGALYTPKVPPFRKDLWRQIFSCLFQPLRNGGTPGHYNAPGLPGATGFVGWASWHAFNFAQGVFSGVAATAEQSIASDLLIQELLIYRAAKFDLSSSNAIFGNSDTVMPSSADLAVGLYLGRTA